MHINTLHLISLIRNHFPIAKYDIGLLYHKRHMKWVPLNWNLNSKDWSSKVCLLFVLEILQLNWKGHFCYNFKFMLLYEAKNVYRKEELWSIKKINVFVKLSRWREKICCCMLDFQIYARTDFYDISFPLCFIAVIQGKIVTKAALFSFLS